MRIAKKPFQKVFGVAAWAFILLSCGPFPFPPRAASGDPGQLAEGKNQAGILRKADFIFGEVSRLRGEPILRPVRMKFKGRSFFNHYYRKILEKRYPPARKAALEKAYVFWGFLPPGADLIQTSLEAILKAESGLYDPSSQTLYIADWMSGDDQEETLAHELTHALQDQYFGLKAYLDQSAGRSIDEQFARAGVMEGEAVAISLDYSLGDSGTDFTQLPNIADWMNSFNEREARERRALGQKATVNPTVSFPYVYGTAFLQSYVKTYGWEGMDYLFRNPPTSTHQILHPETFFPRRHNPVQVYIDDLSRGPLEGWKQIWDDTLGEFGLATYLSQFLPREKAWNSASGWEGDRVQVYEDRVSRRLLGVGYVIFGDENSAEDFFNGFRDFLDAKYPTGGFRRSDDAVHWMALKGLGKDACVEKAGRRVVFVMETPSPLTPKILGALWNVIQTSPSGFRNLK